ncbi:hypothetical protein C8J56DRAFT_914332 [Mycena floridula]|nr:hypothetical protein C8J56DRAFT_914332 [Mycena floridula]
MADDCATWCCCFVLLCSCIPSGQDATGQPACGGLCPERLSRRFQPKDNAAEQQFRNTEADLFHNAAPPGPTAPMTLGVPERGDRDSRNAGSESAPGSAAADSDGTNEKYAQLKKDLGLSGDQIKQPDIERGLELKESKNT